MKRPHLHLPQLPLSDPWFHLSIGWTLVYAATLVAVFPANVAGLAIACSGFAQFIAAGISRRRAARDLLTFRCPDCRPPSRFVARANDISITAAVAEQHRNRFHADA